MRGIKFRGLSKQSGKFVYGNLIQTSEYKDGHIHCWIQEKTLLGLGALSTPTTSFIEVHSKTVGQFTGLTDKNSVDTYDGDIINIEYNYLGRKEVKFFSGAFNTSRYAVDKCVVIGNIHQNKELLK